MNRLQSIGKRVKNLTAWFHGKNERPLFGFFLDSQYPLHRYKSGGDSLKNGFLTPEDIKPGKFIDDYTRLYSLHERAGGDLIWSAAPFFGLPWIEASLGCNVVADLQAGSTHTRPPEQFSGPAGLPEFSPRNPWILKMLEFIPVLLEASGGTYPIGTTLIRGISDILAALYGNEKLIFKMIEEPDEIRTIRDKLTDYLISFGTVLMESLPLFYGGTGSFFYNVWCPGKTIWLQEDAAALLSPALYEEFILPANCKIFSAFEHSVMHLHPSSFIPYEYLIETSVDVIELHRDRGGKTAEDLLHIYKQILSRKPLIIWGDLQENDIDVIFRSLPAEGLLVNMVIDREQNADLYWKRFEESLKY